MTRGRRFPKYKYNPLRARLAGFAMLHTLSELDSPQDAFSGLQLQVVKPEGFRTSEHDVDKNAVSGHLSCLWVS
jgi:hypothetical protein